ncbi:MAG: M15 family metallopeptidase [Clostridia bacterium]|nr:M15 family metallopeptidase [Clostridia bacterium]
MKIFICVLVAIMVSVMIIGCVDFGDPTLSVDNSSGSSSTPSSSEEATSDEKEEAPVIDFDSYELRLVNPWNSIPEGFDPELALINKAYAGFDNAQFDARAIDQLHAMCAAAKADGIKLIIISAYRTNDYQTMLFNNKVTRVMNANPSLSRTQAEKEAEKVVARPGTSEHQVGLAVDFNSVEDSFKTTDEYAWLVEHCTDYGFILRYSEEKQKTTGIIPEPWHYRYVGVDAAKKMKEENLCLEEFIKKYKVEE